MAKPITYVGLDVHKDTIAVALAEAGLRGEVREHGKIPNTPTALKALAMKLAPAGRELRFCYEAGPISMRRAAPLPALVMPPWRRVRPLECSDGTRPRYAMSWRGLVKRVMSPSSATKVAAATSRTPRKACSASR
jgi:hypothetical protein